MDEEKTVNLWSWFTENERHIIDVVQNAKDSSYIVENLDNLILGLGLFTWEIGQGHERERLIEDGRLDLSKEVEDFSKKYSQRFDVKSFNRDGTERHIEVKASKSNSFIITRNELFKSEKDKLYWVYVVSEKKEEIVIKMIKNPSLRFCRINLFRI